MQQTNSIAKRTLQVASMLAMALVLTNCGNKKTTESTSSDVGVQTPQIESTPMSFDPSGSDSGKIAGLETIHFDYDKAALRAEDKKKIQGNVEWMKSHEKVSIQIEGHCDARGSAEYNLALGERRARAVKGYMTTLGIPDARISIISYGKEKPVATGDSESAFSKNRRANFLPLQ